VTLLLFDTCLAAHREDLQALGFCCRFID